MTIPSLKLGEFQIYWLNGGHFRLDGGTMFGAVPKILWEKKCAADRKNTIPMCNDVLLIKTPEHNILIDTGIGNKLSEKQLSIFQVSKEWSLITELAAVGLTRADIDLVLLTHCDFDHAGGIVMRTQTKEELSFPNAVHYIQQKEWEDVEQPNRRAQSTYWPENFAMLKKKGTLQIISGDREIISGVKLIHTGGHTRGHQLVEICSKGETAVHLGDLYPTHAHTNPLWIMAYDNFPLEVINRKEEYFNYYQKRDSWFTFYHDLTVKACKLDTQGMINLDKDSSLVIM
jgi:glyoxylase-like metal-dependent hydrolase (beta-lactamase superfamily II)